MNWTEFFLIASVHFLALISPGPDFAMILQQSIKYNKKTAIYTAVGLGLGTSVHVFYSLVGLGVLINSSVMLYNLIKTMGGVYLIYLGIKSILSKKQISTENLEKVEFLTPLQSISRGVLTNLLNPKVTVFFLSLFTQVVRPDTLLGIQLIYGLEMVLATMLWFSFVAVALSTNVIKSRIQGIKRLLEKITGAVLVGFGIKILTDHK